MPTSHRNSSLMHKLGMAIGTIGITMAGIMLILMTEPSLKETANGYFIIGVGLLVIAGALFVVDHIVKPAVADLRRSWSRS